jgi:hypothetical protein
MTDFVALLGVKGGPAIRPGSNMPTSILLSLGAGTILVDAGLGVSKAVCDQGVALTALDAILVTHLHSDHYLELGPLLHTAWTAGLNRPVPVYGPPRLAQYWQAFLTSMEDDIALRIADEGRPDLAGLSTSARSRSIARSTSAASPSPPSKTTIRPSRPATPSASMPGTNASSCPGTPHPFRKWWTSPAAPTSWSTRPC